MLVHISLTEGIGFDIKYYNQYNKRIERTHAMLIYSNTYFFALIMNDLQKDEYYSRVSKFE